MSSLKENELFEETERSSVESVLEEPLSEREVRLSIYEGVHTHDEKPIKTAKEHDEWTLQMNYIQEWYE